jgi:hypothetical protein
MHVLPFGPDIAALGTAALPSEEQTGTFGERYEENKKWLDLLSGESARQHPGIYYGSALAAGAPFGAAFGPKVPTLAKSIGIGSLWGAGSGAGEGWTPEERAKNAIESGIGGGFFGGVFHGAAQGIRNLSERWLSPEQKAMNRTAESLQPDVEKERGGFGDQGITPQQDWEAARQAGYPVTAMDLGGGPTKALARATANLSPDARDILQNTVMARANKQNERMADLMDQTFGGATGLDTATARDSILRNARANNLTNYTKAYSDPAGQSLWTPGMQQLMEAPQFRSVLKDAQAKAENYAALSGQQQPKNPFSVDPKTGKVSLDPTAKPPDLMYWDQVRRSLQGAEETAIGSGNKEGAKDWNTFKRALTSELDTAVPAFKTARQGAYEGFNAENALDAGLNYLKTPPGKKLDDMNAALGNMSQAEKAEFTRGMAAAVKGKSLSTNDSRDLLSQFNDPLTRQKFQTAFGPLGAAKVEASLRWESAMNLSNNAVMRNSSTVQQWADAAKEGGGSQLGELGRNMRDYAITGRELTGGSHVGAMVGAGAAVVGHLYNQALIKAGANPEIANFIAKNLSSGDPNKVNEILNHVASRPMLMRALRGVENSLVAGSGPLASAVVGGAGPSGQPR